MTAAPMRDWGPAYRIGELAPGANQPWTYGQTGTAPGWRLIVTTLSQKDAP